MANHQVGLLLFLLYTQLTWGQFPDTRNNVAVNQNQRIRTAYDENLQDSVDFAVRNYSELFWDLLGSFGSF